MTKKLIGALAVCGVLLFCVIAAGCSGPTASPTPSTARNSTTHSNSSKAAASTKVVTPSQFATATPSQSATIATPMPSAVPTAYSSPIAGGPAGASVLFFYLPGCPHCEALENSSSFIQLQNKVPVTWLYDQSPNDYGVTAAPTLILLKNGVEVNRWVGVEDATAILAQIGY